MDLRAKRVLSFDCYGTLIDWETGIWQALQPLLRTARHVPHREDALAAFATIEPEVEHENPRWLYREILVEVHARLATRWNAPADKSLDRQFGDSVGDWPVFPDTVDALARLEQRYRLIILSNVDRQSFARTKQHLGATFAAICTAEDIGSYKPDLRNFRYLLDQVSALGFRPDQLLHVAQSLYHDIAPAETLGIDRCWINRRGDTGPGAGATRAMARRPAFDLTFPTLGAFAAACDQA